MLFAFPLTRKIKEKYVFVFFFDPETMKKTLANLIEPVTVRSRTGHAYREVQVTHVFHF